jgi:plastocyanin
MKRNTIIAVLIIALVALGFYFYDQNNKTVIAPSNNEEIGNQTEKTVENTPVNPTPTAPAPTPTPPVAATPTPSAPRPSPATFSDGSEVDNMAPDVLVTEVVYDGTSFTPKTVNIKVGDIVIFRNKSTNSFWPASAPHPSHTIYPEFDAKKEIAAGGKFEFKFTKEGKWNYHDHLNPSAFGTVNVTK